MLSLNNISYKIEGKTLLEDISLNFEAGKLNLIIGPNGAGKSTLVKIICNQIQSSKGGTVIYGTKNATAISISELARMRSVLSQNIELAFPLTVSEIVMMGRYPHFDGKPTEKDHIACKEAMQFFDVYEMANRNYMTLSGGEKQRVHFARVVAQIWYPVKDSYRYLILDEPLTFLDIHYQFDFMTKLVALLKNKDIVVIGVVHDLNLASKFADYLVLLHKGKLLAEGDKHKVLSKENIKIAYQLNLITRFEDDDMYLFFN